MEALRTNISIKKLLTIATTVLIAWLVIGGLFQYDGLLTSFATMGMPHTALRIAALVSLLVILFSRPPRSLPVRFGLGAVSTIILVAACFSMMDFYIGILDAIVYLQVSIILAMEAIENQTAPVQFAAAPSTK